MLVFIIERGAKMNKKDISVLEDLVKKLKTFSKEMEESYNNEEFEKFHESKKKFLDIQKKISKKIK